jgi:hypothetical protein
MCWTELSIKGYLVSCGAKISYTTITGERRQIMEIVSMQQMHLDYIP